MPKQVQILNTCHIWLIDWLGYDVSWSLLVYYYRFIVFLVDGHNYDVQPEVVMRAKYGIKITLQERQWTIYGISKTLMAMI